MRKMILVVMLVILMLFAVTPLKFLPVNAEKSETRAYPLPNDQVTASDLTAEKPLTNIIVESDTPQLILDNGVAGSAGSGWKLDVNVGRAPGDVSEVNPSIATYINQTTGAVTLWVAMQGWNSYYSHYYLWVWRSDNRGATWWQRGAAAWMSNRSIVNPSIAVSPYNGTVFVAVQYTAFEAFSHDIAIHVISPEAGGPWASYNIDADAEDDRDPHLVSEYSWGSGNMLFVSYEQYWTTDDDRNLCFAYSTNWGKTWTTRVLQGEAGTPGVYDVFTQSDIAYSQRNLYIAYRHSTDYWTPGHIDVMYSTNYGSSFLGPFEVSPTKETDAWEPSIVGSRVGLLHQPTTLWVAYRNESGTPTYGDILASWSHDYGSTWSTPQTLAASTNDEHRPQLTVDGMGTESTNLPGRFHLIYWTNEIVGTRTYGIYYTQIADFEPSYFPAPSVYYYLEGWSTPQGQIIDSNGFASGVYNTPAITTFTRTIGAETIWVPGVAWTDLRNPSYDVYYTTLDTMFTVGYYPSTQTVVPGGSLSFYITVTLNSGTTATATLDITGPYTYHVGSAHIWGHTFSPATLAPTGTSLLTFNTANYIGLGAYSFGASAVIGGYRRSATVTFTVVGAPTLTLNLSPSTVPRGQKLTISGQLTPGLATSISLYYRFPHATGSWALAATIPTNAAGAYSVSATVPMSLPAGVYDLIAVWFNPANGKYAASPIRVVTFT